MARGMRPEECVLQWLCCVQKAMKGGERDWSGKVCFGGWGGGGEVGQGGCNRCEQKAESVSHKPPRPQV